MRWFNAAGPNDPGCHHTLPSMARLPEVAPLVASNAYFVVDVQRPRRFPASVPLVGVRDVRDYKVAPDGLPHLGTSSPLNVNVASPKLGNFTPSDVVALHGKHTAEAGQPGLLRLELRVDITMLRS